MKEQRAKADEAEIEQSPSAYGAEVHLAFGRPEQLALRRILCWLYFGTVLFAWIRLGRGLLRATRLLEATTLAELSAEHLATWRACLELFGIEALELRSSVPISSPATLTWGRAVVLVPADLRGAESNEMAAAFCHELAHIRRRDFVLNLMYEAMAALVFFHPATHWVQRRLRETRELACDDMAADVLTGRVEYADGLVRLAQRMGHAAAHVAAGRALGTFETEMMERRVMNLIAPKVRQGRMRIGACAVAGVALVVGSSGLGLWFGVRPVLAQAFVPVAAGQSPAAVAVHVAPATNATVKSVGQPLPTKPDPAPITAKKAEGVPAGWSLMGSKPENYRTGVDSAVTSDGLPSAFLASKVKNTGGFGTLGQYFSAREFAGKRVKFEARVKASGVTDWAGLWMRVDKDGKSVSFDNMQQRPIQGTKGWAPYEVVLDVPPDATIIALGLLLTGPGEVWISGAKFQTVGQDVKTTDMMTEQERPPAGPVNLGFSGKVEAAKAEGAKVDSVSVASSSAAPPRELKQSVPIVMGEVRFRDGDNITIKEVHGTSNRLEHGNLYEIKGTYRLTSAPTAMLGVSITSNDRTPDLHMDLTSLIVKKGEGSFTVYKYVSSEMPGEMHMSYYPTQGGSSFATAYFGSVNK